MKIAVSYFYHLHSSPVLSDRLLSALLLDIAQMPLDSKRWSYFPFYFSFASFINPETSAVIYP